MINIRVPAHVRQRLESRWVTIPNILTCLRLLSTPFLVWGLVIGWWKLVFGLFVASGVTDSLDGYIARKFNQQSIVGAYLDPIADKVMLISCFVTLAYIQFPSVPLPWWFVTLVLLRELVIIIGATIVVWRAPAATVNPTKSGKLTTFGYMFLIGWLFVCHFASWMPRKSFQAVLIAVAALAFISLLQYLWRGIRWLSA